MATLNKNNKKKDESLLFYVLQSFRLYIYLKTSINFKFFIRYRE
jgi:hypothetical protein